MRPHENLDVWKKGIDFVIDIYRATEKFPSEEKFGLISQLRRASVSIPSNIAEGAARKSDKEFLYFLSNAQGSASEVSTEILISLKLGYLNHEHYGDLQSKLDEIGKMITGLCTHIKKKIK
jgi:four helix bundle protein